MANVLIVEDDDNVRLLLEMRLRPHYTITAVEDADKAFKALEGGNIDLIITDIMMPGTDGYSMVETLRSRGNDIPVIMLTAKDSFADKGKGFAVGCDDYMTKPVNFEELIWRINALMRRYKISYEQKIIIGSIVIDAASFTVTKGDVVEELPTKEFQLLFLLLSYPGKIFSKENILDSVWGYASESDESTVRTHINRLRKRFESWTEFEICTIRGVGYKAVINK